MNARHVRFPGPVLELVAAAEDAVRQIPPAFPLTATVAVNPWLGQVQEPRAEAAQRLARVSGAAMTRPRAELCEMIADGRIDAGDLAAAGLTLSAAAAMPDAPAAGPLPTLADIARDAGGTDWPAFVAERIGLWAAGHYDSGQAFWPAPATAPFASWRAFASRDLTPGVFGLSGMAGFAAGLADDPRLAFAACCDLLQLGPEAAPGYLHRLLASAEGWGQVARARGWIAERDGTEAADGFALLTVRLAWEAGLLRAYPDLRDAWMSAQAAYAAATPDADVALNMALQEAADRAAERQLAAMFDSVPQAAALPERPSLQAAFCIDVRSEVLRRAMEQVDSRVQTIGFAGFFGLGLSHRAAGSDIVEARLPVLLRPGAVADAGVTPEQDSQSRIRARTVRAWGRFKMATVSAFAFVEAAGPIYVGKLLRDSLGLSRDAWGGPAPKLQMDPEAKVRTAAAVLRAMSLTRGFAPVVLIAGHGARMVNAPFASALQCGACGGHAGDVNARALALLLNDRAVRAGLVVQGIIVPDDTVFVGGLHDTVSDEVTLFDVAPGTDLSLLRDVLTRASVIARTERAARLPRADRPEALPQRGADWSEIRPEWGLAGCRAFVAAPRAATRGRDLGGRVFLHDYDWQADEGFATLTLILTAPVVVASWIALQYHGSAVAPGTFGSGDKLLHNVTGGIGVIEGSAGHLRTGLPWQSVHDGDSLRHEPGRLMVVVAAPTQAISDVLYAHPGVGALFANGWLSLHAMDDAGRLTHRWDGTWTARSAPALAA